MQVTPSRFLFLNEALEGLKATGVPLVALHEGKLVPAAERDDIGPSYVIPQIAAHSGLSIQQSIDLFYLSLIGISLLVGIIGILFLYKRSGARFLGILGLLVVAALAGRIGDVYVFAPCAVIALMPWLCYGLRRVDRPGLFLVTFIVSAAFAGLFHVMRAHAASGAVIFGGLGLLVLHRSSLRTKGLTLCICLLMMLAPMFVLRLVLVRRDNYIREHNPGYHLAINRHPFWHSVYIGLGFVYNEHVPGYRDEVGEAKVKALDPKVTYVSTEYEALLKHEVFKIHSPTFWINNFGAKAGVIAAYLLIFGNIGVVLRLWMRKPFAFDLPFLGAMAFSALPGLLVVPYREYLLGFIALAVLYNVAYINYLFFSKSPLDTSDRRDEVGINSPAPISR
jgi:hypothetical protein